jgi:hypothetical protein
MKVRNLSPVTQRCYGHAVAKFAQHFNQSPDRLRRSEFRARHAVAVTARHSAHLFDYAIEQSDWRNTRQRDGSAPGARTYGDFRISRFYIS